MTIQARSKGIKLQKIDDTPAFNLCPAPTNSTGGAELEPEPGKVVVVPSLPLVGVGEGGMVMTV